MYLAKWHETHVAVKVLLGGSEGAAAQGTPWMCWCGNNLCPYACGLHDTRSLYPSCTADFEQALAMDAALLGRLKEVAEIAGLPGGCIRTPSIHGAHV